MNLKERRKKMNLSQMEVAKGLYFALRDDLGNLRKAVDTLEMYMPKDEWPTPSYTDLLFYL